jgi:sugar lactone lactonase YvrE
MVFLLDLQGNLLRRNGVQWDDSAGFDLKRRGNAQPFNNPTEIAVNGGEVAVLDTAGTRVQIMDLEYNLLSGFNIANPSADHRDRDNGLALDSRGNIYVAYADTSEVRMYDRVGRLVASFGQAGSKAGEFSAPRGLWFDASDRFYVTGTANARVQLFQWTDR